MLESHYGALICGYGVALLGWLLLERFLRGVWPAARPASFERPWLEIGVALVTVVGILAVGQAYLRLGFFPGTGPAGPVLGAINQIAIFSPVFLALVLRSHSLDTVWLGGDRRLFRLGAGIVLAALAVAVYSVVRVDAASPLEIAARIVRYRHLDEAVQVLLEDVTIAFLFVRLAAAIGPRWSVIVVAALFAAGHVPALLQGGAGPAELALLLRDAALGAGIILVLQRSRDILWFWPVHFVLDMTQFREIVFG